MNYIKEFYEYNKALSLVIVLIIVIFLGVSLFFIFDNNNNQNTPNLKEEYQLILFGDNEIIVYKDEKYQEIGYYAIYNNQIVTKNVKVVSNLDTSKEGIYEIVYRIGSIEKKRKIKVIENPNQTINDIEFKLLGQNSISINVGDKYEEPGYVAYDKEGNNISNKVQIKGTIDLITPGIYYITYSISENNEIKILKREIIVKEELGITFNYKKDITNQDIVVEVSAKGSDFSYIKFPNGTVSKEKNSTFTIRENGVYYFYVYDNNKNNKLASINIDNIDKSEPTATCSAKSYYDRTEISVVANDNSGIEKYVYNGTYSSENKNYTISKKTKDVNVVVYDKAGNKKYVNCNVTENLIEMHFIAGVSDDDAILIRTNDKTIMIDGGRYEARNKIVSYLQKIGVTKIDALIGSHVHWNHVQSHAAILDNFEVDNLYYSVDILNCVSKGHCKSDDVKYVKDKIKQKKKTPKVLKAGDKLILGDIEMYFIGPIRGKLTTYQNANSLVFILKYGNKKYLFTGDTPSNYMNTSKFSNHANTFGMNLDIDVLKWPHHGYETLTDAFFKATTPKYAIIPNCCWCSSSYPGSTNKKLMEKYGTKYYQVCDSKNIVLTSDGETINIKTKQQPEDYKW